MTAKKPRKVRSFKGFEPLKVEGIVRPKELKIESVNGIGLRIEKACRLPEIKFYVEGQSVLFWATVHDRNGDEVDALQYLNAEQAMKFAKAMEACAIEALRQV